MFLLMFAIGEKKYGIDVEDIVSVVPAFDLQEDTSYPLPFMGWREYQDMRLPVFDLNYAITNEPIKRLFGTRHVIVNCKIGEKIIRIAVAIGGLESVSEFTIADSDIGVSCKAGNNDYPNVVIVDVSAILREVIFDYE